MMGKRMPDCIYYPIKKYMDGHDSTHYVVHKIICPIIKYGDKK
jgi:hypothetical protein